LNALFSFHGKVDAAPNAMHTKQLIPVQRELLSDSQGSIKQVLYVDLQGVSFERPWGPVSDNRLDQNSYEHTKV
jgi:hypothetical protein